MASVKYALHVQRDGDFDSSPISLSATAVVALIAMGCPILMIHLADWVAQNTHRRESQERVYSVVDLFCGKRAIFEAFRCKNKRAAFYDRELHPNSNDILSTPGFIRAISYILQLKQNGLLHCGPPCSSWVWVSRGSTKRSKYNVLGSTTSPSAIEGNRITARLCLLVMLAVARFCHVCIEQPRTSLMTKFPAFIKLSLKLRKLFGIEWCQQNFWMATYGSPTMKPSVVFGTAPWLGRVYKKLSARKLRKLKSSKQYKKFQMVRRYQDRSGQSRVQGGRDMTKSSAYPKNYGRRVESLHADHIAIDSANIIRHM
ncbi:unnamed protein product [Durusdinium trenchii]|uniref:Uncharacterized protein n=1 Tax=Durusdinium trenchii TaxID=1381693 RepID=A0ABP0T1B4_9DINO